MVGTAELQPDYAPLYDTTLRFVEPPLDIVWLEAALLEFSEGALATAELQPELAPVDEISLHFTEPLPDIVLVPEMASDGPTRQRAARFIGAVVTNCSVELVESPSVEHPIESLFDALQLAAEGDPAARAMVHMNASTDAIERTIKSGHVGKKVPLMIDEQGKVQQFGQSFETVNANSLRFASGNPIMRARTEAETRNAFRIEQLNREGLFEDYSLVVFSLAEDMEGFFTETMSCSIQVTSKFDAGLAVEAAFVSGKRNISSKRHDTTTVIALGNELGVDYTNKTTAEIIDMPVLVRNDLLPLGAMSVVQMWDKQAGTFVGEDKPVLSYAEALAKCRQRERTFEPRIELVVNEVIALAHTVKTRLQAVELLHKVSEKHMVVQAVLDPKINPVAFGAVAAAHIEHSRLHLQQGDIVAGSLSLEKAVGTARSFSCPSATSGANISKSSGDGSSESSGPDEYVKMTCPYCGDTKQWGFKCSPNQHCTSCSALVIGGNPISKGNGGKKKKLGQLKPRFLNYLRKKLPRGDSIPPAEGKIKATVGYKK